MDLVSRRTLATIGVSLTLASAGHLDAAGASPTGAGTANELRELTRRLTHENVCRRAGVELAQEERFYLVLDPDRRSLALKLRGAVLREIPLGAIEVGRPHRFFSAREHGTGVRGRVHRRGRLEPQRPVLRLPVQVPEEADEETATIMLPPEPETAIPVPERFFIRYEGVVLEFRTRDGRMDWKHRLADGFSGLFAESKLRLHLVVDPPAAEAFYRSVPPDTDLLVR